MKKKTATAGKQASQRSSAQVRQLVEALMDRGRRDSVVQRDLKAAPEPTIREVLRRVLPVPAIRERLLGTPFPKSYGELGMRRLAPPMNLEQELRWNRAVILHHCAQLTEFLKLRNAFDEAIVRGDFKKATSSLEDVKKSVGVSLWTLRSEFLLAERLGGLELNRERLSELRSAQPSGVLHVIGTLLSARAEESMSCENYDRYFDSFLPVDGEPGFERVRTHLRLRTNIGGIRSLSTDDIAFDLSQGASYALVDRFETYLRSVELIAATAPSALVFDLVKTAVKRLVDELRDERLHLLEVLFGDPQCVRGDERTRMLLAAIDRYTEGDYVACAEQARHLFESGPVALEPLELFARARDRLGRSAVRTSKADRLTTVLSENLVNVISRGKDVVTSLNAVRKLAYTLEGTRLGGQLLAFALQNDAIGSPFRPDLLAAAFSNMPTPRLASAFAERSHATAFLDALGAFRPDSTTVALFRAVESRGTAQFPETVPEERRLKYRGILLENTGNYEGAIHVYRELYSAVESRASGRYDAIVRLHRCYLAIGAFQQSTILLCDALMSSEGIVPTSLIDDLIRRVPARARRSIASDPAWPILHFVRFRGAPPPKDTEPVYVALSDFLVEHAVRRPSELAANASSFELGRLIFLLRHVCTPTFMDSFVWYESTEELEQERVAICELLESLDPTNVASYREERAQIANGAAVRHALQEIDRSKVHVDTKGIRESLPQSFKEGVERYQSFLKLRGDLRRVLEQVRIDENGVIILSIGRTGSLVDESLTQFRALFLEVRRRFISSNEHGLDSYLSVQIRHTVLGGHLRSPFENATLITRREQDGAYSRNEHWAQVLAPTVPSVGSIDTELRRFSESVDSLIEDVKNRWIQIRGELNNTEALFDFEYTDEQLRELLIRCEAAATYDELLDAMFAELWERTRLNLAQVRNTIEGRLYDNFRLLLGDLEERVRRHAPFGAGNLIAAIASCRTELHHELSAVASWFSVDNVGAFQDYGLSLVIDAAIESIRRAHALPDFSPAVRIDCNETFRGVSFPHLLTALTILLENVVRHSRETRSTAKLYAQCETEILIIEVANQLDNSIDVSSISKLAPTLEAHAKEAAGRFVRTEGKSGYYKLGKLLRHDLARRSASVEVEVREKSELAPATFVSRITMELQGLTLR